MVMTVKYIRSRMAFAPAKSSNREISVTIVARYSPPDLLYQRSHLGNRFAGRQADGIHRPWRSIRHFGRLCHTKQITHPLPVKAACLSLPDNRTLAYASERNGNWQLYLAKIVRKEDPTSQRHHCKEEAAAFSHR